ncbi:MAG: aldehyde-activating protein [Caulobacterales bacterium]|nr:aldehyde-activating protein [Caulobacterales bacterium]
MTRLEGQCHCGAVAVRLETPTPVGELPFRACQCGFCRRHGAATTSDPAGRITIACAPDALSRYRFGQKLSNFLMCDTCGVYVGSLMEADGAAFAILNVRGVDLPGFAGRVPESKTYDDETPEARTARRKALWSPVNLALLETSA